MRCYTAFGGCLASTLEMPDLPSRRGGTADWRLEVGGGEPPERPLEPLGEHEIKGWVYRLWRTPEGLRLEFAECYRFDLLDGGRRIVWYPAPDATPENVRALVLGPVLALAHHLDGALSLHGSAVAVGDGGIAFLAPKHHGKSTLALALTLAGGRHLSDDVVVVDREPELRVRPGVHSVRMWNDTAAALAAEAVGGVIVGGTKQTLTELPKRLLQQAPVPLRGVYVLRPVLAEPAGEPIAAAERFALSPSEAAVALTHHTKLPQPLVGREASILQFQRAAEIARAVPVYALRVVRDFDRLDEVVDTLLGWHGGVRRRRRTRVARPV